MKGHKLNNEDAIRFIFAGNSTSTFLNTKTDNRFTYKVKKAKDSDLYFVSVLTSPDIYTYIGTILNGLYKHGKKSNILNTAQSVKVFDYVLSNLNKSTLHEFIEIWHEGTCGKCGRALTVPSSIINGLGPECYKKITKEERRELLLNSLLGLGIEEL
jgi:hypothetical protein